jgi:hypothetical protein
MFLCRPWVDGNNQNGYVAGIGATGVACNICYAGHYILTLCAKRAYIYPFFIVGYYSFNPAPPKIRNPKTGFVPPERHFVPQKGHLVNKIWNSLFVLSISATTNQRRRYNNGYQYLTKGTIYLGLGKAGIEQQNGTAMLAAVK